jgi:hypothetical protein
VAQDPTHTRGARLRIEADIVDLRKDEEAPRLYAYAFSQSGRLLGRSDLKEGKAELQVPATKEPEAVRVVIGPELESRDEGEVLSALMRLRAPERMVRPERLDEPLRFAIDRPLWHCWLRWCLVRGVLLKRITTGGLHVHLPVCDAEIEIYEVDPVPVILPRIPELVLERIRELVRRPPPPPPEVVPGGIPFPPVPPGPGPDPAPFLGGLVRRAGRGIGRVGRAAAPIASIRQEVLSALSEVRGGQGEQPRDEGASDQNEAREGIFNFASGEAEEIDPQEALASVHALAATPEIVSAAKVSLGTFKSALLAKPALLHPLLCSIWPHAVTMQLVAKAKTDDCGRFRAVFFRGCSSDTPDLYFRAYRRFGFFRIQIYGPLPIACHTYWNYTCGSEVTLVTTSPFAQTCPPCLPVIAPAHWVLAMAVGNTSLAAVRGTSQMLQPTTNASNIGLTSGGAPFGGHVRLRFEFDNTLRTDLNVRYYRVRWRKIGSGNPFVDLTDAVWRHYAHMVGSTLMIEPYKLGPQPVGGTPNLYEIPPALPPAGQWSIPDAVVDTTSAAFPAALAPANGGEGDYQFELTLFDGGGAAVNANTLGINYVVPTTLDLTSTITTVGAGALGLVTAAGRLVFQLHIDNNRCDAALQPPQIAGSASSDACGLLRYEPGDTVTLQWTAIHPNGFATFKHAVVKGTTELPAPMTTSGFVGAPPGTHSDNHSVASLLGDCTIAGFAETVSVWATATDGWSRQSQYDDHAIQAFALAPEGA